MNKEPPPAVALVYVGVGRRMRLTPDSKAWIKRMVERTLERNGLHKATEKKT